MNSATSTRRTKLFISKATPGDDQFALWIAPRLEAAGYEVFADILELDTGDPWRTRLTTTLQDEAVKMLLCCSNETLKRKGVLQEIGIATDLMNRLPDPNFIFPLRLRDYQPVFGIVDLQYINFEKGWAVGLQQLLKSLERQNVPRLREPVIQPEWAAYHRRRVRRQGFWDQRRRKLRESLAHLIGLIMRRAGGDASVALRVSFV